MRKTAEVAIIGGGIIGCALAYELARLGLRDVVLFEKDYLTAGSTGRCGAGVRQQWGLEMNIRLARGSCKILETLAEDLEYEPGIEFKQGGYLVLAFGRAQLDQFKKNVALQNSIGTPSRLLTPGQAAEIVPHLDVSLIDGATFCAEDGHANPFHTTMAYARAARRLGVEIRTYTEVTGLKVRGDRVTGLTSTAGDLDCGLVFNAAGGYSQKVAAMAGVDLPVYSERHQILVTEPVNPVQGPMVISFTHGLYCQQVPHGSFIMGLGDPHEPKGFNIGHSWQFMEEVARKVIELLPPLAELRVVRQWSGLYNITPDAQPILGGVPGLDGYAMAVGFSGHGFMIGPMTARLMAQHIAGEPMEMSIDMLDIGRFDRGELIREPSVV